MRQKLTIYTFLSVLLIQSAFSADRPGSDASYLGGTLAQFSNGSAGCLDAVDPEFLVFWTGKSNLRVAYEKINLLEYGQKVSRRVAMAVLISPMLILAKKKQHFLTIGFHDEDGRQQAMVFRVPKSDIRTVLVTLEARTGLKVQYQDEDARRGGKG
jgi:hypothetical protein